MADSAEKLIKVALMNEMRTFPLPSGWTPAANLSLEGAALVPALSANSKFISADISFSRPIRTDLTLKIPPIRQGFMMVGVKFPRNNADIDVTDLAGQIAEFFRAGRPKLYQGGIQVRFDEDPEIIHVPLGSGDTHRNVTVRVFWRSYPNH